MPQYLLCIDAKLSYGLLQEGHVYEYAEEAVCFCGPTPRCIRVKSVYKPSSAWRSKCCKAPDTSPLMAWYARRFVPLNNLAANMSSTYDERTGKRLEKVCVLQTPYRVPELNIQIKHPVKT